jgi:peptide/nickel transport system permease protein
VAITPAVEPDTTAPAPSGGEAQQQVGGGLTVQILRVFAENRLAVIGVVIIVFMIFFCFLGPLFYHTNQTNAQLALTTQPQNAPPGSSDCKTGCPLGTDNTGFDMLGRIMYGGQVSLIVGFAAAGIATVLGVLVGAISGFFVGWVDSFMMRIVDVLLSVPILYLLIVLAVIFHPSVEILILVIGFTAWLVPARLVRGETLSLRVREFVQAVRVMGGGSPRIVVRHIIPNTIGTIIVNATFQVADAILLLAALGFIGLGVPAPKTDWGNMIAVGTNGADSGYWWEIYPTGLAIVLVVVAFNFVGDALRDAFEVRLQRR